MKTVKDKSAMRKARRTAVRKARRTAVRKDDYMIGKKQRHKDDVLVEKADGMIGKLRHDDMLVEVLIRLPVKKLFQFMCVSKLWRSIIIQPWFRVDYLKHNPCGLLIRVDDYWRPSFWYSTLREAEAQAQPKDFFNSLTINDRVGSYSRPELTQTINGLFCLIFFGVPVSRLFLFSVWRGEIMKLPEPRFRSAPGYHFGFEPVEGVYKLLAMSEIPRLRPLSRLIDCHILTLNSSNRDILSWKKIPSQDVHWVPVAYTQSFCVNGCMFWLYHPFLISFDLKEEKFRSVHPPNLNSYHFKSSWITQFKGRLALFKWDSDVEELVLYTLDDKDGFAWTKHVTLLPSELQRKVRSDIFDDDQGFIWTKYVTCLPKDLRRRLMEFFLPIVVPVGNLPTGELLLANATSEDPFTTVYSYNHNNNSFQRLVVGKFPQSLLFRRHDFIGHVADIISCVEPNFSPADIFLIVYLIAEY